MAEPLITAHVEIDEAAFQEFVTGFEMRQGLELMASAITPRAVAKTGRKSGRLRKSMGHRVVEDDDGLVVEFGSGTVTGDEVEYSVHHWAPGKPGGRRANWPGTRPWTRTLDELGIEYETTSGFEV